MVSVVEIDDTLQLIPLDPENVAEAIQSEEARIWVNLQDAEPTEIESWLDTLGVQGLTRQLCLETRDRPGYYPLKRESFFVLPVLSNKEGSHEAEFLACLCRENLLLTLQCESILRRERLVALQDAEAWLPERTIPGLLSSLLILLSQGTLRHTTALRSFIHSLEQRMDREPGTVEAEEIIDIRCDLLPLWAAVGDALPVLQALSATDLPHFKLRDARHYMNCALANLQGAHNELDRMDDRIDALHAGFQMHAQDRINHRLEILTILSAIFMPITLLAGIWGMNFEVMPELTYSFGYPLALGLMAAIGVSMYLFFRKRGWFE